jgi:ATP-binding cassette subfamily F protein uup
MMAQLGRGAEAPSAGARPREPAVVRQPLDARPSANATPSSANRVRRRMTFKDRHSLEALPERIAALQDEVARLTAILAAPDLYAHDPARFAKTTERLARAQVGLGAAEEEWLTLEMLREEVEP